MLDDEKLQDHERWEEIFALGIHGMQYKRYKIKYNPQLFRMSHHFINITEEPAHFWHQCIGRQGLLHLMFYWRSRPYWQEILSNTVLARYALVLYSQEIARWIFGSGGCHKGISSYQGHFKRASCDADTECVSSTRSVIELLFRAHVLDKSCN